MKSILATRLKTVTCFEPGALEFAARKTVGLSGDCRRAFLVCQEAAKAVLDLAEAAIEIGAEVRDAVKVRDVVNAVRGMTDVPQLQALRHCR
jgi:Cdc6-like AAA superfamily ATPase